MENEIIIPLSDVQSFAIPKETTNLLTLFSNKEEILRFEQNGDIFLKGKLIENDLEVVEGFRLFLKSQSLI